MTNPLVAGRQDSTTEFSGVPILESVDDTKKAVESGDWAAGVLGVAGTALDAVGAAMDPFGAIFAAGVGWLMEHVGPVKDALDSLTGDADEIKAHAETWKNISRELADVSTDLANLVKNDTASWVGAAGDAYRARSQDTANLLTAAQKAADGASNGISTAGEVVGAVRSLVRDTIAELVGHLVSWALQVVFTLGIGMTWVVPQVVAEVAKVTAKISGITSKLVQALQKLAPMLSKLGDSFGDASKALKNIKAGDAAPATTAPAGAKGLDKPLTGGGHGPGASKGMGDTGPAVAQSDGMPTLRPGETGPASTHSTGSSTGAPPPNLGGSHTPPAGKPDGDGPSGAPTLTKPSSAGPSKTGPSPGNSVIKQNPRNHAIPAEKRCTGTTEPVDLATGAVVMTETDLEILVPLSLVLERMHLSSYRSGRWFGPSWTSTLDQRLEVDEENVCYFSPDGMILVYPLPPTESVVYPLEGPRWPLNAREEGGYSITEPLRDQVLHFGPVGEQSGIFPLLAVEDGDGRRIDIDQRPYGPPRMLRHSDGYRVEIETQQQKITAVRVLDPEKDLDVLAVRYGYDTRGRLSEVINSSGIPLRYEYDDAGRLAGWHDRNGGWFRYVYDDHGRCVRTVGHEGYFDGTISYHGTVTRHTDSLGGVREYHFNDAKQLVREVDPLGNAIVSMWDRHDRLLSRTDPLDRTTHYEYDDLGRPSSITRADGSSVRLNLNGATVGSITVDDGERLWTRVYGEDERPDPLGGKVGVAPEFRLDRLASGRLADETSWNEPGSPPRENRDLFGRPTEVSTATGGRIQLGWTVEGRPAWRVDTLGGRAQWRYDPEGNEIAHVDQMGNATAREYGPFDVVLASVDATGARTTYSYDTERRLTSVTNPQGQTWRYVYDLAGRVVEESDFDGRVLRYVYDAAGQLVRSINGAGEVTEYVYDVLGNLVEWHAPSGITSYTYAPVGYLIRAANADAVLEFERDDQGRITAETIDGRTVRFEYDDENGTLRRITPSGVDSVWSCDAAGRPLHLALGGHSLDFSYDAAGREIQRSVDGTATLAHSYDGEQRLVSQTVTASSGQAVVRRRFHYRADGHLVGADDGITGDARFQLDPKGRIVEVIAPNRRESYRYDGTGNIVSADGVGDVESGPRRYTGNTLVAAGAVRYRYDAQGRLVLKAASAARNWNYTWDSYDRLVSVTTPEGAVWQYRYDPLGRRIAKQRLVPGPAGGAPVVAEQVEFVWDGGTVIEQIHTTPAGRRDVTIWEHHPDDGVPVAQLEYGRGSGQRFHMIVTDAVGKPMNLVDANGMLTWQESATLWGREVPDRRATARTPLRFPGQYADAESGLYYNVYRYYDPAIGRYISQDPLGLAPAPNPAAYVGNPHRETDPLGLACNQGSGRLPNTGNNGHGAANLRRSHRSKPEKFSDQRYWGYKPGPYDTYGGTSGIEADLGPRLSNRESDAWASEADSDHCTAVDDLRTKYNGGWIRGHLLNSNIGGPGTSENLTPMTVGANARYRHDVEDPLKEGLAAAARKSEESATDHFIGVEFSADVQGQRFPNGSPAEQTVADGIEVNSYYIKKPKTGGEIEYLAPWEYPDLPPLPHGRFDPVTGTLSPS